MKAGPLVTFEDYDKTLKYAYLNFKKLQLSMLVPVVDGNIRDIGVINDKKIPAYFKMPVQNMVTKAPPNSGPLSPEQYSCIFYNVGETDGIGFFQWQYTYSGAPWSYGIGDIVNAEEFRVLEGDGSPSFDKTNFTTGRLAQTFVLCTHCGTFDDEQPVEKEVLGGYTLVYSTVLLNDANSNEVSSIGDYSASYLDMFFTDSGDRRWTVERANRFFSVTQAPEYSVDPFNPGGVSGPGGGAGEFSGTGDAIEIPALPTLSAVNTGFIKLYNPTIAQLQSLSDYMWSDLFDLNAWRKIFADPMNAILGMSLVPVAVPDGGASIVTVGNISTGIEMNTALTQFVTVDCGTIDVKEYWGAYLDYDPYTKADIYLPYIGVHPISVDDIMNKSIHVVYHVDILSGACCAYVKCGESVLYTFVGHCSCSIPITGNDWTNVLNGALTVASSIGTMVATGGASAPMSIASIASTAVNSFKPSIEKSGALGGMGGMMGIQTPYLIVTRPRQALPESQNMYMGYPSFITSKLADLAGYTEVESIHLENVPATEQELSEIETLLKGGVIL